MANGNDIRTASLDMKIEYVYKDSWFVFAKGIQLLNDDLVRKFGEQAQLTTCEVTYIVSQIYRIMHHDIRYDGRLKITVNGPPKLCGYISTVENEMPIKIEVI